MESFNKPPTVSYSFSIGSSPLKRAGLTSWREEMGRGAENINNLFSYKSSMWRSYYEKMRFLIISHGGKNAVSSLRTTLTGDIWYNLILFVLSLVARHQVKTWFLWHISDRRNSSKSDVVQLFQLMWLNATQSSSAVHPSSICLQKGLITWDLPPCFCWKHLAQMILEVCQRVQLKNAWCSFCVNKDDWNNIKSSRGCCFWSEHWGWFRSPEGSGGAGGYEDGGVTRPQLPFCEQWLLSLTAAASDAGKAGSTYKTLRTFHDGALWEIPPGTHLSWHQAKQGTALQLCVQARENAVLSLPTNLRCVLNQAASGSRFLTTIWRLAVPSLMSLRLLIQL